MRILQAEPVHSSPIQHAASNRSSDRTHMVRVTLLAMAASLLFLTCKSQALTTTTDTNTQAAVAQTPNPSSNAVAPGPEAVTQNVRVVRLSDVEGTVQIVRDNQTEFSHAVMNMPLTQGTQIETGPDGRAEVEFEDGSVTRITPNSTLSLAKLSTSSTGTLETTLEQPKGLVYYELRSDPRSAFSVDFDNNKVNPTVNSTFRVNLGANPAELAVIDGNVQVQGTASQTATAVPQGKTIELQPSGSSPYTLADGIVPNGFDQWNDQRDEEAAKQAASQTTARAQQGGGSMLEGGWGYGWAIWTRMVAGIRFPDTAWFGNPMGPDLASIPMGMAHGRISADLACRGFQDIHGAGSHSNVAAGRISVASAGAGCPADADSAGVLALVMVTVTAAITEDAIIPAQPSRLGSRHCKNLFGTSRIPYPRGTCQFAEWRERRPTG